MRNLAMSITMAIHLLAQPVITRQGGVEPHMPLPALSRLPHPACDL